MSKYRLFTPVSLPDRQWPDRILNKTPVWCSVDLRDGNQALVNPMNVEQKLAMFDLLVKIGFKQIEVGFPSASQTEYDFVRRLIENQRIPSDVTIQVLCQAREHLVERTMESIRGAHKVIFHLYSSTSPSHRTYTFGMDKQQTLDLAVEGVRMVKRLSTIADGTEIFFEYSPESFTQTEPEFSLAVCEAVRQEWGSSKDRPIILNLPATVEICTPNQHADQIEWFLRRIGDRGNVVLSLHTHNDRGTGVAAAELGLLAGADRVEGTLFANGERTGNLDLITLALNFMSQGIETGLDISDITSIGKAYTEFTGMDIHERHPYAGELVFTAFSGSHQDAIKKALDIREQRLAATGLPRAQADQMIEWDIPYLPIDPNDIGRTYEAIIRINSQSGKGGVAWVLRERFGLDLPKAMHPEVGQFVNTLADSFGRELTPEEIWTCFSDEFLARTGPLALKVFRGETIDEASGKTSCEADVIYEGRPMRITGEGTGPLDAFVQGLAKAGLNGFEVVDFHEDALTSGADSQAAAYVKIRSKAEKTSFWGCGMDKSITKAGLTALISAFNRAKVFAAIHA